jgi:hypothetical protein
VRSPGRKEDARKVRGPSGSRFGADEGAGGRVGEGTTKDLAFERPGYVGANEFGVGEGGKCGPNESPRYGLVKRSNEVGKVRRPVRRARGRLRSEFERSMNPCAWALRAGSPCWGSAWRTYGRRVDSALLRFPPKAFRRNGGGVFR